MPIGFDAPLVTGSFKSWQCVTGVQLWALNGTEDGKLPPKGPMMIPLGLTFPFSLSIEGSES